jgi:hypothetical protein
VSLGDLPDVAETRRRLELLFPEGVPGRGDLVRELAARTVLTALFVGAVGDPDARDAALLRPSMVTWMSDEALERSGDHEFRRRWHRGACRGRRSVAAVLASAGEPHVPWYADNTREPIRDEILRPWRERYGAVLIRAGLPATSPAASMTLAEDFAEVFNPSLDASALVEAVASWQAAHLGAAEQARLGALRRLEGGGGQVRLSLPGRGERLLPPGASSALARAVVEELAPRLLRRPFVLALCHGGDPTADEDRRELERLGLSLDRAPALPDVVIVDAESGVLLLIEIVVTGGAITDARRDALLKWARDRGYPEDRCRLLTVYRSRSEAAFRRTVGGLAWDTAVWLGDEPDGIVLLTRIDAGFQIPPA